MEPLPHYPLLSAARVRALFEVRAVTDPPWSAAGNHRNRTIVPADVLEREITPGVGYGRNVPVVVGSCNEFQSEQFFVTEISTRFFPATASDHRVNSQARRCGTPIRSARICQPRGNTQISQRILTCVEYRGRNRSCSCAPAASSGGREGRVTNLHGDCGWLDTKGLGGNDCDERHRASPR